MELILTGDFIQAEEAVRIGLASRAVPHDQLMEEAHKVGGLQQHGEVRSV
jgi:enoyl-CoA hydratase